MIGIIIANKLVGTINEYIVQMFIIQITMQKIIIFSY